jgi:phosphoglycolate phosphatase (TIGR01487 family)
MTRLDLRMVVTDVDGTLTTKDRRLDPRAIDAVRRVEESGVPVTLATGNVLPVALALHRSLRLSGPIVAENGGLLYDPLLAPDRVQRLADPRPARAAYRHLRTSGLPVRRLFTDRWRESEVALEPNFPLDRIRKLLRGREVDVEFTGYAIHLMARGFGKLPALQRALEARNLLVQQAAVLGDGDNDVPMLRAAGLGVSFPNGSRRARSAAKIVTRASYAGGFVEGLRRSGLLPTTGRRRHGSV